MILTRLLYQFSLFLPFLENKLPGWALMLVCVRERAFKIKAP